jgi:N-methylhydantoinase A
VDVGGTFTDFALYEPASRRLISFKEPSTTEDPAQAVRSGLEKLLERAGVAPRSVGSIVHGTTLGLNTLLQRNGVRTALVVSDGNRDVLELGRAKMPSPYNFALPKEEPLVPRDLVFEIDARIGPDGRPLTRPSARRLKDLVEALRRSGVDAVAVMLVNAYLDDTLEREVADALADALGGVAITSSAEVWPEIREYERATLATMNAYLQPSLSAYFERLQQGLRDLGISGGLYLTTSNGGTIDVETAKRRPIETLLSGPASGVVAAAALARQAGRSSVISVDMGGTSCDMGVSRAGEPEYTTATHVGEFPFVAPVVAISTIGAGGGSIVWIDSQGVLKVGPRSAGAVPGPAAYGRGGAEPTITDCYVAAGMLNPAAFLGGRIRLDASAARRALGGIARRLGFEGQDAEARAAEAGLRVATAKMATELFKGMAQRGLDPRDFALLAYGGAGPTHAGLLALEAGLHSVIVPLTPGTFCALGAVMGDVKRDYVRSVRRRLTGGEAAAAVRAAFEDMRAEAAMWIEGAAARTGEVVFEHAADMRYVGQAYEIAVRLAQPEHDGCSSESLAEAFHDAHERLYGFRDPDSMVEAVSVRLRIVGRVDRPELTGPTEIRAGREPRSRRRVFVGDRWVEVPIYDREDLGPSQLLQGPVLVEQEDTTVFFPHGWSGEVDARGNLLFRTAPRGGPPGRPATDRAVATP